MHEDVSRILFSEQDLSNRVAEMGSAITRDYADATREEGLILISVLRGAAIFMADLAREIKLPLEMDYMAISSYGSGVKSSGVVNILKDLSSSIEGRHVLIAEDILDSGAHAHVSDEEPAIAQSRLVGGGDASSQENA